MSFFGLFKLSDVTRERRLIRGISESELMERLAKVTDQSTNVGFMTKGKKFHGLVNNKNFSVKRLRTFRNEEFTIKGKLTRDGDILVLELAFIRGPIYTIPGPFFFVVGLIAIVSFSWHRGLDFRYLPIIAIYGVIFFVAFNLTRKIELEKIKLLLDDVLKGNVKSND